MTLEEGTSKDHLMIQSLVTKQDPTGEQQLKCCFWEAAKYMTWGFLAPRNLRVKNLGLF